MTSAAWSRVGGDMVDLATLAAAYRDDNPKKANVGIAMALVTGIAIADQRRAEHPQPAQPLWRTGRDYQRPHRLPQRHRLFAWQGLRTSAAGLSGNPSSAAASPTTGETSPASADLILEVSA